MKLTIVTTTGGVSRQLPDQPQKLSGQIRVVRDQDQSAFAGSVVGAANRAPRTKIVRTPGGQQAPADRRVLAPADSAQCGGRA
ncbi:hypothetical protein AB0945_00800 [Streptomyces sp. NPDC005474]|uniref:hypothetical protein n=1 Tax=Streptomyces sp. NPDC005474 TaxID=3154878 RepID=UPI0034564B87